MIDFLGDLAFIFEVFVLIYTTFFYLKYYSNGNFEYAYPKNKIMEIREYE